VCKNARHRTRPVSKQLNWKNVSTAMCTKIACTYTTFPGRRGFSATSSFYKNIFSCLQKCAKESLTKVRLEMCFDGDNE